MATDDLNWHFFFWIIVFLINPVVILIGLGFVVRLFLKNKDGIKKSK